jgi:endogenous inhibitor of DNA gyrase (YacG/DUF329 family)
MAEIRCPICERYFESAASIAMPFCSPRCKQIDLGRWLGEKYSLPVERTDDDEEDVPPRDLSFAD